MDAAPLASVQATPWPVSARRVVATLTAGTRAAERARWAPHHRRADGHGPHDLSGELGAAAHAVTRDVTVGRAFPAKLRISDDPLSQALGATPAERATGVDRVVLFRVPEAEAARRLAAALLAEGLAESAHPVAPLSTGLLEPDPTDELPSMKPGGWALRFVHGDEALELEPGSRDVLVAVCDTGIELTHPEFAGKLVDGYDFVDLPPDEPNLVGDDTTRDPDPTDQAGHGTHVAGVIGAHGLGMIPGLGGSCRLMPVRVLGTALENGRRVGIGQIVDIDAGLKFAVDQGADVVNLSLGMRATDPGLPHQRMVDYARLHNVALVAASGNDGRGTLLSPASIPGVITVGAITELGRVAPFSTTGEYMDVVAPGTAIYSADIGGGYRFRSGTSHAAPFVSGVAALLVSRARRHGLRLPEHALRRVLRDTADRGDNRFFDPTAGRGVLNARDAVLLVSELTRDLARRRAIGPTPDDDLASKNLALQAT
jgi:subtilisin family serine protease